MGVIVPPAHDDGLPAAVRALAPSGAVARPATPAQAQFAKVRVAARARARRSRRRGELPPTSIPVPAGSTTWAARTTTTVTGHDYTLYSFRDMDRGVPIRAAAPAS